MRHATHNPLNHPSPPTSVDDVVACRICGCSDDDPCAGGCWWVPDPVMLGDLCSNCLEIAKAPAATEPSAALVYLDRQRHAGQLVDRVGIYFGCGTHRLALADAERLCHDLATLLARHRREQQAREIASAVRLVHDGYLPEHNGVAIR